MRRGLAYPKQSEGYKEDGENAPPGAFGVFATVGSKANGENTSPEVFGCPLASKSHCVFYKRMPFAQNGKITLETERMANTKLSRFKCFYAFRGLPFSPFSWYPTLCYGYQDSEYFWRSILPVFALFVLFAVPGFCLFLFLLLHSLCILHYASDTKAPNGSCEPFSPFPRFKCF